MNILGSTVGWTQISRSDVSKATEILRGDERGIRDEVGFLALHQGFANRFFPGTSVLQTRLRYSLFVPWQITDSIERARGNYAKARANLERAEQRLVLRLMRGARNDSSSDQGIIGSRSPNYDPGQPPSTIFWSALREWHILQPLPNRRVPSRDHVLATGSQETAIRADDGMDFEVSDHNPFYDLPDPPKNWRQPYAALTFKLAPKERKYLRERIGESAPSLLAYMATAKRPDVPWNQASFDGPQLRAVASSEDKDALKIASDASALAHIGRAVYSALVEHVAESKHDNYPVGRVFRDALRSVVEAHRRKALECDIREVEDAIRDDLLPRKTLQPYFRDVLETTKDWLKATNPNVTTLLKPYRYAEWHRKRGRARLADYPASPAMRQAWIESSGERIATGLSYRWHRVRQMMDDLHAT